MERARAAWTDERLDDLARRVEDGFNRVDNDLRSLRRELGARIEAQGAHLGARIEAQGAHLGARMEGRSDALGARIDALQRTMLQVGGATIAAVIATLVSVLAT
jgi:hypothetical protein